jgi:hypothetical protein
VCSVAQFEILLYSILQNPIPTNKPGVEPKRPPRPVNITTMVKLSPTVANHITVSWNTEYGRGYAIAVYLVRKLTSSELLQRLKTRGVRHSDFTRGLSKYSGFSNIILELHVVVLIMRIKYYIVCLHTTGSCVNIHMHISKQVAQKCEMK